MAAFWQNEKPFTQKSNPRKLFGTCSEQLVGRKTLATTQSPQSVVLLLRERDEISRLMCLHNNYSAKCNGKTAQ